MAHVEKISYTRYRIPAGKSRSGKPRFRWVNAVTPGAEKVERKSKKYYAIFDEVQPDGTRKRRKVNLKTSDKQIANGKLAEMLKNREQSEAGFIDPYEAKRRQEIDACKQAYLEELKQKGRAEQYRYQTGRLLAKLFRDCQMKTLADLTAERLDGFLKGLSCSARTKNTYRQACIGLVNYMIQVGNLPHNHLLRVSKAEGEKKRKRRALAPDLLQRLLDAARKRPLVRAMTIQKGNRKGELGAKVKPEDRARLERVGRHRALLYLTALHTGLRLGELAALQVTHFELTGEFPCVRLPGEFTKNGREAHLPIRADLVTELQAWFKEAGKNGTDKVFDVPPYSQISKLLKKDLGMAKIPYRDERGRYFDFHALRKCTGTYLRRANIDPALSQKFMRHSDIRLTMEIYNDEDFLDLREAVAAMPALSIRDVG